MTTLADLKSMPHIRAPSFFTGTASYCSVVGPTADGMVHLQFYRDFVYLREENMTPMPNPANPSQMGVQLSTSAENFDTAREDVGIISMPAAFFTVFAAGLQSHVQTVEKNAGA